MKSMKNMWGRVGVGALLSLLLAMVLSACGSTGEQKGSGIQPEPPVGSTEFVSASGLPGTQPRGYPPDSRAGGGEENGGEEERVVEEGDIFRLMGEGLVLNLNTFRGVQVLDVSNVNAPAVIGTLRLAGTPVEGYVLGDVAVIMLNDWYGYAWTSEGLLEQGNGGAVLLVDLSDPTAPTLLDQTSIQGWIRTSRLVSGGGDAAVYVAAERWSTSGGVSGNGGGVSSEGVWVSSAATVVASLEVDVAAGKLVPQTTLELGGWVSDIHATPEALLVARADYATDGGSLVSIVDISDPSGTMVKGGEVVVAGVVRNQFNLDLRGDILRVVSGGRWTSEATNHLETFDVSNIATPVALDHETFGEGQELYATIFLGDRAFFVTYFVQDPFHAFMIDEQGDATEMVEYVISGWNDFFRPVLGDSRLVGVGVDDAGGTRRVAVSLYDTTDLTNPEPLVERAVADLEHSWSEASWDHRAFSVLQDAVSLMSPSGSLETGLVLLPYNGWTGEGYRSGVQLFTFGASSVTARGSMIHGAPVRRSFLAGDSAAANLSDIDLKLWDISNPNEPEARGSVSLAPAYSHVFAFGDYVVRVENPLDYGWYDYYAGAQAPALRVQVVPGSADPDAAAPIAEVTLPAGASLVKAGDLLVAITWEIDSVWPRDRGEIKVLTKLEIWDFSNPTSPQKASTLETTALAPSWRYGGYPEVDAMAACWGCGWPWWWGYGGVDAHALEGAVAFVERFGESEPAGVRKDCWTWPANSEGTSGGGTVEPDPAEPIGGNKATGDEPKTWYGGGIHCSSVNGGAESCGGSIVACSDEDGSCVDVDPKSIETKTECNEYAFDRYWERYVFHVLDLRNPAAPIFAAPVEMPSAAAGQGAVADGTKLWYSSSVPFTVEGDNRPYVKYYATPIDVTNPAAPTVGPAINVPGQLLLAEGNTLYTQDFVYGESVVESAVSRVTVTGSTATLAARHRFGDRVVSAMKLDGAGRVAVLHGPVWLYRYDGYWAEAAVSGDTASAGNASQVRELTILDATEFAPKGSLPLALWATLEATIPGRALVRAPGGYVVVDIEATDGPVPRSWFPALGWPGAPVIRGTHALFASGRYGIVDVDLHASNLLPELSILK